MHQACGRSDDTRLFHISDLAKPLLLPAIGPSLCQVFLLILKGGKVDKVRVQTRRCLYILLGGVTWQMHARLHGPSFICLEMTVSEWIIG